MKEDVLHDDTEHCAIIFGDSPEPDLCLVSATEEVSSV